MKKIHVFITWIILTNLTFYQSSKAVDLIHDIDMSGVDIEARSTSEDVFKHITRFRNIARINKIEVRSGIEGLSFPQFHISYKQYPILPGPEAWLAKQNPAQYQQSPIRCDHEDHPYQQYPSRYKQNPINGCQLNTPYRQSPKRHQQIATLHHHIISRYLRIRRNILLKTSDFSKTADVSLQMQNRNNQETLFKQIINHLTKQRL